jgi:hypothetical protein
MFEANPFVGTTRRTPRPTGTEPAYRYQTRRLLARDQRLWDAAEQLRLPVPDDRRSVYAPDLIGRMRLEYLATAAGTVAEWNRAHARIIADALAQDARLRHDEHRRDGSMSPRPGSPR